MKFDLISDFHVEMNVAYQTTSVWKPGEPLFYAWHKDRKSDVLVIAGDSSNRHEFTREIIAEAAEHYEHVMFVDGNHDHYSNYQNKWSVMRDMEWFNSQFNTNKKTVDNVTYLQGDFTHKVGRTLFIGENGWYNFSFSYGLSFKEQRREWRDHSNDYVCIRYGKKNKPEMLAARQKDNLKAHVIAAQDDDTIDEIVVVTHTLPIHTAFGSFGNPSHPFYALNGAYGNEFMKLVWEADEAKKIKTWCFGHTHERRDFFEHGIHFVCNPRGYRGEKKWHGLGFAGIIEVDTEEEDTGSAFGTIEP